MSGHDHHGGGGRQQRKRPRDDQQDDLRRPRRADILYSLQRDLTNLADPGGNVSAIEDIKYVGRKLAGEFDHVENQKPMLEMIREAVVQLSLKTCQVSAAVTLAGLSNKHFAKTIAQTVTGWLQETLARGDWLHLKLLLRFVAGLDQILQDYNVLNILRQLAAQISTCVARTDYADAVCYTILQTLPFMAAGTSHANTHRLNDLTSLVDSLEPYMQARSAMLDQLTKHYNDSVAPYKQEEALSLLYAQTKRTATAGWNVRVLARFQEHYIEAERFSLAPLNLDAPAPTACTQPVRYVLRLFVKQQVATTPGAEGDLSDSLLRDLAEDVLETCVANRKDAARFLIDLECYLAPHLFVLRGTPLDKLAAGAPGTTWKSEDVVVEALFGQLLALPCPQQKEVYYHAVLTELCKLVPQAVAPTFGRAIRQLYNTSAAMEQELVYRAWDWLSHHLSNFNFNWKWQEWQEDLTLPALVPKQVFIRETILKEVELSYHQRIRTTLPEPYHALIQEEAPGPRFTYGAGHASAEEATALMAVLQQQPPPTPADLATQADAILDRVADASDKDASATTEDAALRLLVECALQLGHQSFSHALNTIEQTLSILKARCSVTRAKQQQTVACVMRFWRERPAVGLALLSKMVNYGIVEGGALVDWLLGWARPASADHEETEDETSWHKSVLGSRSVLAQSVAWELLLQLVFAKQDTQAGQLQAQVGTLTASVARQKSVLAAMATAAAATKEKEQEAEKEKETETDTTMKEADASAVPAESNATDAAEKQAATSEDASKAQAEAEKKKTEAQSAAEVAKLQAHKALSEDLAALDKVQARLLTIARDRETIVAQLCQGLATLIQQARQQDPLMAAWAQGILRMVVRRQRAAVLKSEAALAAAGEVDAAVLEVKTYG